MKKSIFVLLAAFLLAFAVSACADTTDKPESTTQDSILPATETDNSQPDTKDSGSKLLLCEVIPGITQEELYVVFGTADVSPAAVYEAYDGRYHKTLTYEDEQLEFSMVSDTEDGEFTVKNIFISGTSNYALNENIGIGSTKDEVIAAFSDYIDESEQPEGTIRVIEHGVYTDGIVFTLEKDAVTFINVGYSGE